ncbi:hypothetical protein [Paraburkholderia rhizosphaerae]|jgi:hypothetical protein|uniref:Uncharacterized protein n=1 Tax=Paraburkholderia rhizosphaerae TaxID=480658 RepID=A0A4R8LPN4_9BURK|nr:hypothetical protein [Paraburkholderia rhizosphaerae]TDY47800.1 hypothetical protein BX592_112193 [Paraburkholderia rhizosphaerae]
MRLVSRGASSHRLAIGMVRWRIRASARSLARLAALGAALALITLSTSSFAQVSASSHSTDAGYAALADTTPAAAASPETAAADREDETSAEVLNTPADVVSMNDVALDDQVLARQRGGASGLTMVAATPQLTRGSSVTLWDEIAPPAPLPVPVDAARAAQSNVASYMRK